MRNLRWVSRRDNIKKAYRDGVCDERIRMSQVPVMATDIWTGKRKYFNSIGDAAAELHVDRSTISHVLREDHRKTKHYTFDYADREDRLLYGGEEPVLSWV